MRNTVLIVVVMLVCVPMSAMSKEGARSYQFHGAVTETPGNPADGEAGLAKAVKKVKLPNYQSKTFGEAVDSYRYFSKKGWKETHSSNGKVYVDFTGWLKNSPFDTRAVSARGIGIKFLVKSDGNYAVVMVSKVEIRTDGNVYSEPLPDVSTILNKLYGNVEIKF